MSVLHRFKRLATRIVLKSIPLISQFSENFFAGIYKKYAGSLPSSSLLRLRYLDDLRRFEASAWLEANGIFKEDSAGLRDPENLAAVITMEYHRLEKGLALPNRRYGAGQDVVLRLLGAIGLQYKQRGVSAEGAIGLHALEVYLKETPREHLTKETFEQLALFTELKRNYDLAEAPKSFGGYHNKKAEEIKASIESGPIDFLRSRHSIRGYKDQPIDSELISQITEAALSTPSVCNRQAWKVYAITSKELIGKALSYQNGNRGFAETIPLLFVIAADLRRFVSVEERNQPWIDGGLFSMTLMLAIHAKGLGSCALNWSATRENDRGLRDLLFIPEHEVIIMMISAGNLPDRFNVTASPRRDVDSILKILN